MENSRIRYAKVEDGITRSRRYYLTSEGKQVFVVLNLNEKKYQIQDSVTGDVVATGGDTVNVAVLKIQAKQGLTALGVEFSGEKRTRGLQATEGL